MATKFVQLKDDATGNAVGWIPDPSSGTNYFHIVDPDVKDNSVICATINNTGDREGIPIPCAVDIVSDGFVLTCVLPFGKITDIAQGASLNYVVMTP